MLNHMSSNFSAEIKDKDNRAEAFLTDLFIYANDMYREPLTS
jgi:hypothetical protein